MNRIDLYHKTVDILYQAYFNNTLEHGLCHACAVGNIINANRPFTKDEKRLLAINDRQGWTAVFCTLNAHRHDQSQRIAPTQYKGLAKEQIDSTGYLWQELSKIEYSFETASRGRNKEDYMFNGLVAVLDTLKEIHEITDEESIVKFRKHYETKTQAV